MSMTKMGRPTKYKREFIKEAENYLTECKNARKVPFIEELAGHLGVDEDTIRNWCKANDDFFGAVSRIKDHQRLTLKTLGIKNPSVIIFLLKADHGMIETDRIQHEGAGGEPLSIIFTDVATWKRAKDNGQE